MGGIKSTVTRTVEDIGEDIAEAAIAEGKKKLEKTIKRKWHIPADLMKE